MELGLSPISNVIIFSQNENISLEYLMKIPTYVYLKLEVVEVDYARSSVLLFSAVNEVGEFKSWLRTFLRTGPILEIELNRLSMTNT